MKFKERTFPLFYAFDTHLPSHLTFALEDVICSQCIVTRALVHVVLKDDNTGRWHGAWRDSAVP